MSFFVDVGPWTTTPPKRRFEDKATRKEVHGHTDPNKSQVVFMVENDPNKSQVVLIVENDSNKSKV